MSIQSHANQGNTMIHAEFPLYGLPPSYVPPYEEYPEQEQLLPMAPVNFLSIPVDLQGQNQIPLNTRPTSINIV